MVLMRSDRDRSAAVLFCRLKVAHRITEMSDRRLQTRATNVLAQSGSRFARGWSL
jgi:hypothetical protein